MPKAQRHPGNQAPKNKFADPRWVGVFNPRLLSAVYCLLFPVGPLLFLLRLGEPDLFSPWFSGYHELTNSVENNFELVVVFALQLF